MQPQIKALVFDCGGVLGGNAPSRMLRILAERYGERLRDQIRHAHKLPDGKPGPFYKYWNKIKVDPEYTEEHYWRDFKAFVPEIKESAEEFRALLQESLQHHPDTLMLVQEIKMRSPGLLLSICSNHATAWFDGMANKCGFYEIFDNKDLVIVSQEVRCAKPHSEIYQLTLERLRAHNGGLELSPSEVVFIDDKQENIDAALRFGMHGILFNAAHHPIDHLRTALVSLHVLMA